MTITRAAIVEYLQYSLTSLATETGASELDDLDGYKLPIDAALRRAGETSVTVPTLADSYTEAVFALAEYAALRGYWKVASLRIDITGPDFKTTRSQLFLNIEKMLKVAADNCALLGYPVVISDKSNDLASGFAMVHLELDYVEPKSWPDVYIGGA